MKLWALKSFCQRNEEGVQNPHEKIVKQQIRKQHEYVNVLVDAIEICKISSSPFMKNEEYSNCYLQTLRSLCRQLQFISKLETTCLYVCFQKTVKVVKMLQLRMVNTLRQAYPKPIHLENIEQLEKYNTNNDDRNEKKKSKVYNICLLPSNVCYSVR